MFCFALVLSETGAEGYFLEAARFAFMLKKRLLTVLVLGNEKVSRLKNMVEHLLVVDGKIYIAGWESPYTHDESRTVDKYIL